MADAYEQIRNLLGRYCQLMDAGDFAGLAALFAHGTVADDNGNVFATGSAEMQAMWEGQTKLYDGSPRTRHITANPVIEVDDAAGTATCASSYVVFQGVDDFPFQPIVSGRYADRFARNDDGAWYFTARRYAVDHVGDLSHHLTFDVRAS
ncbi:MAG TPA: nuclear transport factor 2 family protein [Mycobacteriales bacterium]|jgi:ketosteroid isomerase-like protein|nr:nuclear transport factor 2 family protein [Mycobacteriales bacterium]